MQVAHMVAPYKLTYFETVIKPHTPCIWRDIRFWLLALSLSLLFWITVQAYPAPVWAVSG
jgi:hypothetical protein